MKLNKSTTILLNVVLILAIALLVKSFLSTPKEVYANADISNTQLKAMIAEMNRLHIENDRKDFDKLHQNIEGLQKGVDLLLKRIPEPMKVMIQKIDKIDNSLVVLKKDQKEIKAKILSQPYKK